MLLRRLLMTTMLAACCGGCAWSPKDHAIFVTKTSLAIVDADSAPAGVSFAYDRVEGYVGPRFEDGSVMPVVGYFDTDGGVMDRKIRQIYATGNAALIATGATPPAAPASAASAAASSARVMFFGTGTTIGLKVGFAEGTVAPTSFTLGFKRKEMSVIPVEPGRPFTSALASLNNSVDVSASAANAASAPSLGVLQYFATGQAAEAIASRGFIRDAFADAAAKTVSGITAFRAGEASQGKLALDTLACLASVPDARLDRVWADAERSRVFATSGISDTLARIRAAPVRADQRRIYTGDLGLLNADSAEHTQAMRIHQAVVCEIARA